MPIEKSSFEATMREIRRLYRRHTAGEINGSTFAGRSTRLIHQLKWEHIRTLVKDTAQVVTKEIELYQTQFNLSLTFKSDLYYDRGVKARVLIFCGNTIFGEIFIGPRFQWDQIASYKPGDECGFFGPNFYTKRMAKRWTMIEDFDFPSYLHHLKERIETIKVEEREREERVAAGLPEYTSDEIPF